MNVTPRLESCGPVSEDSTCWVGLQKHIGCLQHVQTEEALTKQCDAHAVLDESGKLLTMECKLLDLGH